MVMRHARTRRFQAGDRGEVDGIAYQVLRGGKGPDDLILELYAGGAWRRIRMDLGFFLAAFFFENEEVLYPPNGYQIGGDYYMRECWDAIYHGWESAAQKLRLARAARVNRMKFSGLSPDETNFRHKYPRVRDDIPAKKPGSGRQPSAGE